MQMLETAAIPRIGYGAGALAKLPELAQALNRQNGALLLMVDPGLMATGLADKAIAGLGASGVEVHLFSSFTSDPSLADADAAAKSARECQAALVVAIGGGSTIDIGKAVAVIACGRLDAANYELCREPFPAQKLPVICVPTTSGTGAETTRTSVLSRKDHAKTWLWGEALRADLVLLDPELTASLPAHLTAATGIDALVHAMEAATNTNAHAANNLFAYEAIRLVMGNLERAVTHPQDLTARANMQRAAALAGTAIDNCGTAIAHNIGHALGSLAPIHHGLAVGLAMQATLAWNAEVDDGRYGACAEAMGGPANARECVARFSGLVEAAGLMQNARPLGAGVNVAALAAQMNHEENQPMLRNNFRVADGQSRAYLAQKVLDYLASKTG